MEPSGASDCSFGGGSSGVLGLRRAASWTRPRPDGQYCRGNPGARAAVAAPARPPPGGRLSPFSALLPQAHLDTSPRCAERCPPAWERDSGRERLVQPGNKARPPRDQARPGHRRREGLGAPPGRSFTGCRRAGGPSAPGKNEWRGAGVGSPFRGGHSNVVLRSGSSAPLPPAGRRSPHRPGTPASGGRGIAGGDLGEEV